MFNGFELLRRTSAHALLADVMSAWRAQVDYLTVFYTRLYRLIDLHRFSVTIGDRRWDASEEEQEEFRTPFWSLYQRYRVEVRLDSEQVSVSSSIVRL